MPIGQFALWKLVMPLLRQKRRKNLWCLVEAHIITPNGCKCLLFVCKQAPPKRIRSPGLSSQTSGQSLALRPSSVVMLLKLAYKDAFLSNVCKKVWISCSSEAHFFLNALSSDHVGDFRFVWNLVFFVFFVFFLWCTAYGFIASTCRWPDFYANWVC